MPLLALPPLAHAAPLNGAELPAAPAQAHRDDPSAGASSEIGADEEPFEGPPRRPSHVAVPPLALELGLPPGDVLRRAALALSKDLFGFRPAPAIEKGILKEGRFLLSFDRPKDVPGERRARRQAEALHEEHEQAPDRQP